MGYVIDALTDAPRLPLLQMYALFSLISDATQKKGTIRESKLKLQACDAGVKSSSTARSIEYGEIMLVGRENLHLRPLPAPAA